MVVNKDLAADLLPPASDPNEPPGDGVPDSWSIIVYNGGDTNEPGYHDFAVAVAHCTAAEPEFFPPAPENKSAKPAAGNRWRSLRR